MGDQIQHSRKVLWNLGQEQKFSNTTD